MKKQNTEITEIKVKIFFLQSDKNINNNNNDNKKKTKEKLFQG